MSATTDISLELILAERDTLRSLTEDQLDKLINLCQEERRERRIAELRQRVDTAIQKRGYFLDTRAETDIADWTGYCRSSISFSCEAYSNHASKDETPRKEEIYVERLLKDESTGSMQTWFKRREEIPKFNGWLSEIPFYCSNISLDNYEGDHHGVTIVGEVRLEIRILWRRQAPPPPGTYFLFDFLDSFEISKLVSRADGTLLRDGELDSDLGEYWDNESDSFLYLPYDGA